jgi:SAM-dependent methyltransferase
VRGPEDETSDPSVRGPEDETSDPSVRGSEDETSDSGLRYDRIGRSYTATRRPDPRLAAQIHRALGDARTVLNVGAGTGAYEPHDRDVLAVEPSATMRAQRPPDAAPAIDARAEALPFADQAFDAAMAVLTVHHWSDPAAGLRELRRVARRVVVLGFDPDSAPRTWLTRDYLPGLLEPARPSLPEAAAALGAAAVETVPIPHDCTDGFLHAYWRRPHAYLDPVVRANISVLALLDEAAVQAFVQALAMDLETGLWERRNGHLRALPELDCGYRLLVAGA